MIKPDCLCQVHGMVQILVNRKITIVAILTLFLFLVFLKALDIYCQVYSQKIVPIYNATDNAKTGLYYNPQPVLKFA